MKKRFSVVLCVLLVCILVIPAMAASDAPEIILEPQSPNYPEYSVASYTVKATGTNLRATWYLSWQGGTYNLSDNTNGIEPWEGYAGESYGGVQEDANTFIYFFSGIESDLNGAAIWCVIEDGDHTVTSQKAIITIGNFNSPPVIEDIPAKLIVEQGDEAEIRCIALAPGDTQLSYVWYETLTGKIEDIQAINRGTETSDFLLCDTDTLGTRYYVCCVQTTDGGMAYSSIVPVTVIEREPGPTAPPTTAPTVAPTTAPTAPEATTAPATAPQATTPAATGSTAPTAAPPAPSQTPNPANGTLPWWATALISVLASVSAVCIVLLLVRRK